MNNYLEEVSKNIKNKTAQKAVVAELEAHIEEKKAYYIEIGYSEKEAEKKAIEEMGEAEEAAVSLNALHSKKWYKIPINIVALFLYGIILVYCSTVEYDYGDVLNSVNHSVIKDFGSTLFLGIFVAVIFTAYKKKNKFLMLSVPCFILLMFILGQVSDIAFMNWEMLADMNPDLINCIVDLRHWYMLFTPFFYLLVKIFVSGPAGYIHSVLSFEVFDLKIRFILTTLSVLLLIVLFSVSVLLAVIQYRKERLKNTKNIYKKTGSAIKALAVFFLINCFMLFALSLYSGGYAVNNKTDIDNTRVKMLEFAVDNKKFDKASILKDMRTFKLYPQKADEGEYISYTYYNYNSSLSIIYFKDYGFDDVLNYKIDFYDTLSPQVFDEKDFYVSGDKFNKYKINSYKLKDFVKEDIFDKAVLAQTEGKELLIEYLTNNETYIQLKFKKGVLISKEVIDSGLGFDDTEGECFTDPTDMTLPPTTSTFIF